MKKTQRIEKQKAQSLKEDIEYFKNESSSIGQSYTDHELPPDEVDEKEVERSMLTSLWSMVPYTNEWYEARAAEDEMDDLRKIRIERVKADDLLTMSKMGRHDEALESMMAETNYDFFYFNKLKMKYEEEGKFKFDIPKDSSLFADMDRSGNRNRLKKAFHQVHSLLDDKMTDELNRLSSVGGSSEKNAKSYGNDQPCIWRGKNRAGENLRCENQRKKKGITEGEQVVSSSGSTRKNIHEYYPFCSYHLPFCCSSSHKPGENIKIKTPNIEGYCSECFMIKLKKKPPNITSDICPGVVPIIISKSGKIKSLMEASVEETFAQTDSASKKKKKKPDRCNWIPNPSNETLRIYECANELMIDPKSNQKLSFCPWHQQRCVAIHPSSSSDIIQIPNDKGLCTMHYIAEYGHPPPVTAPPFPGMRTKRSKDFWKHMKARHFATPKEAPPLPLQVHDYNPPDDPENIIDSMVRVYKYILFLHRKYREGKKAATLIQATFRMYRMRNIHLKYKYQRQIKVRFMKTIKIQAQMRRWLATRYVKHLRIKYYKACTVIQCHFRGHRCRLRLYRQWAARRITRFMKLLHFFKFRDTVIMIMQLRRLFKKRNKLALEIQRVFRGFSIRLFIFNKRLWEIVQKAYTKKLQKWYRFHHERRNRKPFRYPGEEWVRKQCAKKLGRMICELYLDIQRRKELLIQYQYASPPIQKMIRGFLGRKGKEKLTFLRSAMRSWFNPQYAVEFMEKFLRNRIFDLQFGKIIEAPPPIPVEELYIRKFISEDKRFGFEVDHRSFYPALDAWYNSINLPLISSEKDAIVKRFRNPINGNIMIRNLDEYIHRHPQPCRKHARRICGDCYYRRNCMIKNCKCVEYKKNKLNKHAICTRCSHPKNLHCIAPLQVKFCVAYTGEKKVPLVELLEFKGEADMSLPVNVQGVAIDEVLVPALNYDDIREGFNHTRKLQSLRRTKLLMEETMKTSPSKQLVHQLAAGQVEGNSISDNKEYWDMFSTSTVKPFPNEKLVRETAQASITSPVKFTDNNLCEKVVYDIHDPESKNISYPQFWSIVPKNPNKTVENYNETFSHNIPVPVVQNGEIVYSFEGQQIYYNLINQIISLEHHIDYDDSLFLRLVADHIQMFERHWRKMVVDIRLGKLDKRLSISDEARMVFESSQIPRPALATKLDDTFRKLGFHKKVLGKDIQIKAYAPKKYIPQETKLSSSSPIRPKRKRSLPFVPSESSVTSMSRINTASTNGRTSPPTGLTSPAALSRQGSWKNMFTANNEMTMGTTSPSRSNTAESNRPSSNGRKTPGKRELLKTLGETFRNRAPLLEGEEDNVDYKRVLEQIGNTTANSSRVPSRDGTANSISSQRRKSFSEAQRPATREEVNSVSYDLVTLPRDKRAYTEVIELSKDRFVCPFPACGQSFFSKEVAIKHIASHEQKFRLSAATPEADAHLNFYWPKDVPWLKQSKYSEKHLPPGAVKCTHPGCPEIFATQTKLDAHLRLIHMKIHPSSFKLGYLSFNKELKAIPPDTPPDYMNLQWCRYHAVPMGKCSSCMAIENLPGPKPPFRIYDSLEIDLHAKQECVSSGLVKSKHNSQKSTSQTQKITLLQEDSNVAILFQRDENGKHKEYKARVFTLLMDRNKVVWLGVQLLFTRHELVSQGLLSFEAERDIKGLHELLPKPTLVDGEKAKKPPNKRNPKAPIHLEWIQIHTLENCIPLTMVPQGEDPHDLVPKHGYFTFI